MVAFSERENYAEFMFRKGNEFYIIRYSRKAKEQTRKVLEKWAGNPEINFTQLDAQYTCRQMFLLRRKSPEELEKKL